ncbi:hypothetical protein [Amycolatopsis decaplanina]|uniref:Acyl-CoA dehydrogenase n=1 Tax=Amycolatopsis decaplanina DSM 44594 TaxID=1284240 RepID=M2WWM2_9PSEU|nr:hypothetical protein [Amycolatopsis decaplanina]EME53151.1 acyl-CoA dehydrogenase [Amycolatopsis decaplanina DSM 44594]
MFASFGIVASLGVSIGLTAQKERRLPGLATFEKVGAWAITEPGSGSDAATARC